MISFIKKLTNKTLKCKPDFWTTRWPWLVVIAAIVHVILGLVVLVAEWDLRYKTEYEIWIGFIAIIILLGMVLYLIYLLRFNVFKRFGKLSKGHYVGTFLIFLLTMMLFVSWGYNPFFVTAAKARASYDDAKVAKDINRINVLLNTLEKDNISHLWTRRKVVLDTSRNRHQTYSHDEYYETEDYDYAEDAVEYASPNSEYIIEKELFYENTHILRKDSFDFYTMLEEDSTISINDTTYYYFDCPDYDYVTGYFDFFEKKHKNEPKLDGEDLFWKVIKEEKPIENKEELKKELTRLISIYAAKGTGYYNIFDISDYDLPRSFRQYVIRKYKIGELDTGLRNISERYYMFNWGHFIMLLSIFYYIAIIPTLLLFLFRHNRNKSFFYSILAGIVVFILTVTIFVLVRANEGFMLGTLIFYFIVFAIGAIATHRAERYNLWQNIGLNLFIFLSPVVLFLVHLLYYELKHRQFRMTYTHYNTPNYDELYQQAFKYEHLSFILSQVIGFILFIALLHFVYSKLLRKSYALPEN